MSTTTNNSSGPRLGAGIAEQMAARGLTPAPLTGKTKKRAEAAARAAKSMTPSATPATASASKPEEQVFLRLSLPTADSFRAKRVATETVAQLKELESNWDKVALEDINVGVEYLWKQRDAISLLSGVQLQLREEDIKNFQVNELLNRKGGLMRENDIMRRYLVKAFARRLMQTCPLYEDEVKFMVRFLEPFGFFQISEKEFPKSNFLFGQFVALGEEYQDDDSKVIALGVSKIQEDIKQKRKSDWIKSERAAEKLAGSKESQLPINQVGHADGLKLVTDPGWEDKYGNERRGGHVVVESRKDGWLKLLMGTSGCQRVVDQAEGLNLTMFRINEVNDGMRDIRSETRGLVTSLMETESLSQEDAQREVRNTAFAAFKTLQRAYDYEVEQAEEAAGRVAEREHFGSLATLTAEQFHATPRPAGAYLVDPLPVGAPYLVPKFGVNRKPVYKDGKPVLVQAGPDATDVFYLFISSPDGKLTESPFPTRLNGFFGRNPPAFGRLVQMDREKFERSQSKSARKAPESLEDFEQKMLASDVAGTPAVAEEAVEEVAVAPKSKATSRKKRAPAKAKSGTKTSTATAKN